jgi:hypothetical protein
LRGKPLAYKKKDSIPNGPPIFSGNAPVFVRLKVGKKNRRGYQIGNRDDDR